MNSYLNLSREELLNKQNELNKQYEEFKSKGLKLDMSRGKPGEEQLVISLPMLDLVGSESKCEKYDGVDCRNYGVVDGLPKAKQLFADLMEVESDEVIVGGNSSLNMMFDTITHMMTVGLAGCKPWGQLEEVKFLCPTPGYDRHFAITEYYGIKMINIPMTDNGPDMDMVEEYVNNDSTVKGIWCVPKYSNPQGITYSNETVTRFAKLKPAAKDFIIMWDNAYCVHDVTDTPDTLLSIMDECKKYGNENLPIIFSSTSKVTFPGAGVAAMASSKANIQVFKNRYQLQTIGYDKINMIRHIEFLKDVDGVKEHMAKHKDILEPRFEAVLTQLNNELSNTGVANWAVPNGGYFVSVDVLEGCATNVVGLCKEAGVVLTSAGATYPYGKDPKDSNIRIAPTFPSVEELNLAMELFCLCVKKAAVDKLLCQ